MKPRLIIANDVAKLREDLFRALQSEFEIKEAAGTGGEALLAIERHNPDIAVVDMVMPDLSAIELTRLAREKGLTSKIVVVSGVRNESIVLEAFQAGVTDYIFTPIEDEDLSNQLLEISRAEL